MWFTCLDTVMVTSGDGGSHRHNVRNTNRQRRRHCSHQVTHAYSGCMADRLGGNIGDGPETVGCGDSGTGPSRAGPRSSRPSAHRARAVSVSKKDGQMRAGVCSSGRNAVEHHGDGCIHSRRQDDPTIRQPAVPPNPRDADQGQRLPSQPNIICSQSPVHVTS